MGTAKSSNWTDADIAALLRWYLEAGVDEAIGEMPIDRTAPQPQAAGSQAKATEQPSEATRPAAPAFPDATAPSAGEAAPKPRTVAAADAAARARTAETLDALREALEGFDGCALKKTATNLCFGRGSPNARVVLIGEAPGQEEDRQGKPFVGPSGRLLDRMLASIGLDESSVFITNTVFWRPPGNREPSDAETQACLPFVQRIVELVEPAAMVTLGGPAAKTMLNQAVAVSRLRGRWFDFQSPGLSTPIPATATYHPAYLLRSPGQKRLAWRDILALKKKLSD